MIAADLASNDAPELPSSPLDSELRRVRRARAFPDMGKSQHLAAVVQGDMSAMDGGLSQEALDALCVVDEMSNPGSPSSEAVVPHGVAGVQNGDELLLRKRRMRAFLGAEAADAFATQLMAKVGLDGEQNAAASTSSTRTTSSKGFSQRELDAVSTADEGHSRKDSGLSQSELDAMSIHWDAGSPQGGDVNEACMEPSSPGLEDVLLRIRRTRAFQGEDAAMALIVQARATAELADDEVSLMPAMLSLERKGQTQDELDKLCIESPDGFGASPSRCVDQIATPTRKRRSHIGGLSPEVGGA